VKSVALPVLIPQNVFVPNAPATINSVEVATSPWWRDADGVLARVRGDAAVVREIISLKVGRKPAAAATGSRGYAGSATARPNQVAAPVLASMKDDDDHELQAVVRRGALQEQIKLNRIARGSAPAVACPASWPLRGARTVRPIKGTAMRAGCRDGGELCRPDHAMSAETA
jgi:hypothetical protein